MTVTNATLRMKIKIYVRLLNHKWQRVNVTIKVQVIRNTAHRPSMQASYTIGSGATMQEYQPAAQIAARHNIFPQMAQYMSWIFGAGCWWESIPAGLSPGRRDSHNTTDRCATKCLQVVQYHAANNHVDVSLWFALAYDILDSSYLLILRKHDNIMSYSTWC